MLAGKQGGWQTCTAESDTLPIVKSTFADASAFHQNSTCLRQSTFGPYATQIRSRSPQHLRGGGTRRPPCGWLRLEQKRTRSIPAGNGHLKQTITANFSTGASKSLYQSRPRTVGGLAHLHDGVGLAPDGEVHVCQCAYTLNQSDTIHPHSTNRTVQNDNPSTIGQRPYLHDGIGHTPDGEVDVRQCVGARSPQLLAGNPHSPPCRWLGSQRTVNPSYVVGTDLHDGVRHTPDGEVDVRRRVGLRLEGVATRSRHSTTMKLVNKKDPFDFRRERSPQTVTCKGLYQSRPRTVGEGLADLHDGVGHAPDGEVDVRRCVGLRLEGVVRLLDDL